MKTKWKYVEQPDATVTERLSNELGIDATLAGLLVQRGVSTFEEARYFFRPELHHLHDPFLMKDMEAAVDRVITALGDGERLMIFGDYDVDGTTSVTLVYSILKSVTDQIEFYIPDRYKEGYGLSKLGIDTAHKNGVTLMVILDCGIKSIELTEYAKSLGIDIVICDHHRPGSEIPNAAAVLDPKRKDCEYPYKELCGCGVGFKLMQALSMKDVFPFERCLDYIDLVAVAIGADIVPIEGENRTLAYYGMKKVNEDPSPGIKAILESANYKGGLSVSDVVFVIGPRINAAGRIASGNRAVELLIAKDHSSLQTLSKTIDEHNKVRRNLDKTITQQALEIIQSNDDLASAKTTVVFHKEWHKGVVGIVASRLTEQYYRPTIVLTESNGVATGSARSVKGYDIYNAIDACSDLLNQFGGHAFAAGLSLPVDNIAPFSKRFEQVVAETITPEQLIPTLDVDMEIDLGTITPRFFQVLRQMAPFGPHNMNPVFVTRHCINAGNTRVVGGSHLKMHLCQTSHPQTTFNGIAFGMGSLYSEIADGRPFSIAYSVVENEWRGRVSIELHVKDIKLE